MLCLPSSKVVCFSRPRRGLILPWLKLFHRLCFSSSAAIQHFSIPYQQLGALQVKDFQGEPK